MTEKITMVTIPSNMVRGKLYRGEVLCSFLTKKEKKLGVRFYKMEGKIKNKSASSHTTILSKEFFFDSPVIRISSEMSKKIMTEYQSLSKEFHSDATREISESNLDTIVKNRTFFIIRY